MKKNLFHYSLLLLFLIRSFFVFAQNTDNAFPGDPVSPTVNSPQVWSMIQYGNPSVALNIGSPYLEIPLIETDDPDFDLGLSITYASLGFRPWEPDNYVGMGWRLNCLGVIQREIHGVPDDIMNLHAENTGVGATGGTVSGIRSGLQGNVVQMKAAMQQCDTAWINAHIQNATIGRDAITTCPREKVSQVEVCPDLYRFHFGKHAGRFLIDYDGSVLITGDEGGRYRVGLNQYLPKEANSLNNTMIWITSDDGTRYGFGGGYAAQEYTAFSWSDFATSDYSSNNVNLNWVAFQSSMPKQFNRTTAYCLSQVISPNGRQVEITYGDEVPEALHTMPGRILTESNTWSISAPNARKYYCVTPSYSPGKSQYQDLQIDYTVMKTALVTEIKTDDKRIVFHYSRRGNPFFVNSNQNNISEYSFVRECGAVLDSVVLFSRQTGKRLEKTELEYQTVSGRTLLKSLKSSRRGRYSFSYYPSQYGYSKATTIDIDKWGFWNGNGSNTSLLNMPAASATLNNMTMTFDRADDDTNREPSLSDYKAFMLQSVTYPTGGTVSYGYEPHDYSEYYQQDYSSGFLAVISGQLTPRKRAGGARVCSETFYAGTTENTPRIHVISYQSDKTRSSGRLLREGDYYLRGFLYPQDVTNLSYSVHSPSCNSLKSWGYGLSRNNGIGNYIEYDKVTEYDYCDPSIDGQLDSTFSYRRHPVLGDPDVHDSFQIRVKTDDYGSSWSFQGGGATVAITRINGMSLFSHSFVSTDLPINLDPRKEYGEGLYIVTVDIASGGYLNFTASYLKSLPLAGYPRKETDFTPTLAQHNSGLVLFPDPIGNKRHEKWCVQNGMGNYLSYWSIPMDWGHAAGKVLSERWYNSKGEQVRSIQHTYQDQSMGDGYYIWTHPQVKNVFIPFVNAGNIVKMPIRRSVPIQSVECEYDSKGNGLQRTTTFGYDTDGYLTSLSYQDSKGTSIIKHISHPHHLADSISVAMTERNMISPVISEVWMAGTDTVYRHKNVYDSFASLNIPLIKQVHVSHSGGIPETRLQYTEYDSYGNPVEMILDGKYIVELWSYSGKYPIALIENATAAEVKSALMLNDLSILSHEALLETDLSILRSGLPWASVHTYEYDPGVGIIRETAPDGTDTYYRYDQHYRLADEYTYDENGVMSVLKNYSYHLVNE